MVHVIRLAVAVLAIALLSACTPTYRVNPEPRTDGLLSTTKKPLHAGVYYSPQFANHERARVAFGSDTWIAAIGPASVKLFDELIPRVFEKTSRISQISTEELNAKGIDVVIAPSLVHFDFRLGMDSDSDQYSVSYRTTLYTNRGVPAASWIVVGKEREKTAYSVSGWIENDMIDAATKYLQGFERNAGDALTAIGKHPKGQTIPVDPGSVVLTVRRAELPGLDPKVATALRDAGLVAIQLTAQNTTERGLVVRASDTRLRLKGGQVVEPSTVNSVLSALDQTSQASGVAAALTGPLVGLLVGASEQRSQQKERETQFGAVSQALFLDRSLSRGKEETGIVPFLVPKGTATAEGMALTVWVVDPGSAEGAQVEVPLLMGQ